MQISLLLLFILSNNKKETVENLFNYNKMMFCGNSVKSD